MSDDRRWADPATSALIPPPEQGAPASPPEPDGAGRSPRHRLRNAMVAGAVGLVLGAALEIPVHDALTGSAPSSATGDLAPATPPTGVSPSPSGGTGSPGTGAQPGASPPDGTAPGTGPSGGAAPFASPTPNGTSADAGAIAGKVDPGIVDVNTRLAAGGAGAGTGMLLTSTGEVLTNNHVVEGATAITVTLTSTGRQYAATVVGTAPIEDVAVIRISGASGLTPVPLGDSAKVAIGDPVVALGNAGGLGGTPAVATGSVIALDQTITASDSGGSNSNRLTGMIETDAPIQPGDSGGPLVNASAQVIGMDTAASANSGSAAAANVRGFAIPIARALSVVRGIRSGRASDRIHLGLPGKLGVSLSSTAGAGAVVGTVEAGSPAERAGIAAGDRITAVNGTPVAGAEALGSAVRAHRAGEQVVVAWTTAAGQHRSARITLAGGAAD